MTLGRFAELVRSKNAGPFWITLDVFMRNDADYECLMASKMLTPQSIAEVYKVNPDEVLIFALPTLCVVKISFPRTVVAGSFEDRDQHAGQQYIPLAAFLLPTASSSRMT